ncbi:hypothetical protein AVEN_271263-1 [Araneus ventricosus]|uniref:Uncharacterized protein n=1 Tax=Araneus ventricosus TaxID=182803 RepID=A0A4Y2G060_ARAVE|nr:hypothetical protein AVEN_271263-1 [Araneus ventricosus]
MSGVIITLEHYNNHSCLGERGAPAASSLPDGLQGQRTLGGCKRVYQPQLLSGTHSSADCFSAQKMSLADRLNILKEKNCCFACLNVGHSIRKCRIFLKCVVCGKKHVPLMSEAVKSRKHESNKAEEKEAANEINVSNISLDPKVFLQTLKVKMISDKKEVSLRIILDSGSQRSYILKNLAEEMGYIPVRKETLVYFLFGRVKSEKFEHTCYQIRLRSLENNFACTFEALDQLTICNDVTPVNAGPWMRKRQETNITLADVGEKSQPVQVLIDADLFGKFLTGHRRSLSCGMVAIEISLGWTLSGKVPGNRVTSKQENLTKEHFLQTVRYNDDKRYEVHLPWLDNYAPLPDSLELAIRRLESTTKKLLHENLYDAYEGKFLEWLHEGIIEKVPVDEINLSGNYLPHRPALKESSTTPIRPVFDASARMKGRPSLNESLHSGPNLIKLIPDILLQFREKKIGVTAVFRKVFLQISICKEDKIS